MVVWNDDNNRVMTHNRHVVLVMRWKSDAFCLTNLKVVIQKMKFCKFPMRSTNAKKDVSDMEISETESDFTTCRQNESTQVWNRENVIQVVELSSGHDEQAQYSKYSQ